MDDVTLTSLEDTDTFAKRLAPHLKAGDVIALQGGLGAGKTTFCRSLISALMGQPTGVPSPTYTLVQTYDGPSFPIFHFDLYRLEQPEDVLELGWDETQDGLCLIEWPDRAGPLLPNWRLDIQISVTDETRQLALVSHGEDWQRRLNESPI